MTPDSCILPYIDVRCLKSLMWDASSLWSAEILWCLTTRFFFQQKFHIAIYPGSSQHLQISLRATESLLLDWSPQECPQMKQFSASRLCIFSVGITCLTACFSDHATCCWGLASSSSLESDSHGWVSGTSCAYLWACSPELTPLLVLQSAWM